MCARAECEKYFLGDTAWVQIPALILNSCVALGNLPNLSMRLSSSVKFISFCFCKDQIGVYMCIYTHICLFYKSGAWHTVLYKDLLLYMSSSVTEQRQAKAESIHRGQLNPEFLSLPNQPSSLLVPWPRFTWECLQVICFYLHVTLWCLLSWYVPSQIEHTLVKDSVLPPDWNCSQCIGTKKGSMLFIN